MKLTDELKILDDKIKANQAQYDLSREAAKISALPSKNLLDKYEYLTGEELGYKPNVFKKAKFEYSPLSMSLNKVFKRDEVKSIAKSKSDFNYDNNHTFYKFYRGYDEFEMSLDSKYNRMKEFNKLLIGFKSVRTEKTETQLRKERIMKNVDELYEKYYNTYKSDYETDDELNEAKKKKFDRNQFKLVDKTDKELKLDEETKELKLTALPKCLRSKNDFNEATKLINNIKADTINDISKNLKKEDAIKRMEKSISDLEQLRQKESVVFQNKMIFQNKMFYIICLIHLI